VRTAKGQLVSRPATVTNVTFPRLRALQGGSPRPSLALCLGLDISGSITNSDFYAGTPERKNRWISMG